MIKKIGKSKWRLYSKDGSKNLGTYNSISGAKKRERQVQYFKHIKEHLGLNESSIKSNDDNDLYKNIEHIISLIPEAKQNKFSENGQLIIIDSPSKGFPEDLKLETILHEELDISNLKIIDISGCFENGYDIDLPNGETIECNEIADQFYKLLSDNKIRMMNSEEPLYALINSNGDLFGGIVGSINLDYNTDEYNLTFSIAVDDLVKRQGYAKKLIAQMIKDYKHRIIKNIEAQVINPNMEPLLMSLGFEKKSNESEIYDYNIWIKKIK